MQYRLIESFSTLLHRRTTDNRFLELHQKISEFTDRNNFPSENAKKPRRKREFEAGFEIRGKVQKVVSGSARWKRRWNLAEISFYYRNWIERERERDRNSKQVNEVSWLFVREQIKFRFKLETRWIPSTLRYPILAPRKDSANLTNRARNSTARNPLSRRLRTTDPEHGKYKEMRFFPSPAYFHFRFTSIAGSLVPQTFPMFENREAVSIHGKLDDGENSFSFSRSANGIYEQLSLSLKRAENGFSFSFCFSFIISFCIVESSFLEEKIGNGIFRNGETQWKTRWELRNEMECKLSRVKKSHKLGNVTSNFYFYRNYS